MHVVIATALLSFTAGCHARSLAGKTPLVVALDFHGVVMDSEPVMARVAWRTSSRLWPQMVQESAATERVMDESAYVDRRRLGGEPLRGTDDSADEMPNWLRAKMRLLSPIMQTDEDALLLLRLCMDEASSADSRKRPLTVGEIIANWGSDLKETLQLRYRLQEHEASKACAETRAAWQEDAPSDWAEAHQQFPATLAEMREAVGSSSPTLYFFARSGADACEMQTVLANHGIQLPPECFVTAARAQGKVDALATLRVRHADATLRFVDDCSDSLRAAAADPRLFSLQPFFASWGYSTAQQMSRVAAMPRVRELTSSRELGSVLE